MLVFQGYLLACLFFFCFGNMQYRLLGHSTFQRALCAYTISSFGRWSWTILHLVVNLALYYRSPLSVPSTSGTQLSSPSCATPPLTKSVGYVVCLNLLKMYYQNIISGVAEEIL